MTNPARPIAAVRSQTALVRALLDEVERRLPGADVVLDAQLVEELARLGCRFVEAADALSVALDDSECAAA